MVNPQPTNPTGRFSGLASLYARYRPSYPAAAIDFIIEHCGLSPWAVLVDVGCGTGISSRLFAARGLSVIGIEPNADMREQAEAETQQIVLEGLPNRPEYRDGRAEAIPLLDGIADAVLAAQAFHWFEPGPALQEFHRVLKPGGWAVLIWNERDERDPFTAAYGAVIRSSPGAAAVEMPRARAGQALLDAPLFENRACHRFSNSQELDEEGVLGRAFSASYAPREPEQAARFRDALASVFATFQQDGRVSLRYETSVYVGRRPGKASVKP
jgi:SAM-dependent methyltransferase